MVAQLTKDWLDGVLGKYENAPVDSHAYGVVTSINADGSYQVQLNSSSERARCAAFCSASLGDKVVVLIFSDGRAAAIATLGGEGGGGGGTSSDMAFTVLFQPDDPAGTSEDFSLTESAGNFEILEFQYTDGDRHMTKRVYQPNGKYVALDRSVANPEKGMYTHSAIAHISGSSVTISNFGGLCVTVNGTPEYQNIETIKVTAVLGWSNATEFPNPSNYYLKSEVDTAIEEAVAGIDVPEVDLTNYYTKAETDAQIAAKVPTVVSAFVNDAGYIGDATKEAFIAEIVDRLLYTDLSYIKSDGTAYILLDFIPTSNSRVVCELEYTPTKDNLFLFGSRTSSTSKSFTFSNYSNKLYRHSFGSTYDDFDSSMTPEGKFKVDKDRNVCTINDEHVVTLAESTFEGENEMAIFAVNTDGTIGSKTKVTLYNMQVYENDVLVLDLVPRKHLTDGYGLYDKVNAKFYANAHSSGSLTGA